MKKLQFIDIGKHVQNYWKNMQRYRKSVPF